MPTPYDSVLRIQKRAMDAIRLSLLVETMREQELAQEHAELETDLVREAAIAANDWQVGAHPYSQRLRTRRAGLESDRRLVDARMVVLRDSAMAACGEMVATTSAASDFAKEALRRQSAAEQAHLDDLSGVRFASSRRVVAARASGR